MPSLKPKEREHSAMIRKTRKGFIAEDLEESIAAPGTGEGVVGITCDLISASIDATVTVSVIYYNPPQLPPVLN